MQYVFVLGGWDGVACHRDIAVYSPDGAPSTHMAPNARSMLSPRDALSSVVVEHDIVALGGHDGSNYLASCEIYTASTPGSGRFTAWTLLPAMGTTRAFHASCAIGRKIFAYGGQGSQSGPPGAYGAGGPPRSASVLSSLEVLDLEGGVWTEGPPLPSKRTMVAGVSSGNRVFCFGGREGKFEEGDVLSSAIAFDPRTPRWEDLPPMSVKRYGSAAVSIDNSIYVVGGKDSEVPLSLVEVYDEVKGAWRESSSMANERAFPCVVSMSSFFYVIAGSNRTNEVDEVEEWSHVSSKWRRIQHFKVQADAEEFMVAKEAIDNCTDQIFLLERDYQIEEAAKLRKTVLPLLETRYQQAGVGKLPLWKGGSPRDSLLGMRHLTAQTILPGSTVDMLLERAAAEREAAASKVQEEEDARRKKEQASIIKKRDAAAIGRNPSSSSS